MKYQIMRTNIAWPDEGVMERVRSFLFGVLAGTDEAGRKAWNRLWNKMKRLEPGEIAEFEITFVRNPRFHRRFFALLNLGFEAWDPGRTHKTHKGKAVAKNFERFRKDVTILAGFYEQTFRLDGKMVLEAQSISFANMDDAQFEQVYSAVVDVLLEHVLVRYANRDEVDRIVERLIGFA